MMKNIKNFFIIQKIQKILKGEDKQLKKEAVKRLIQDFEGVEYKDMKEENKNTSNNISKKFGTSTKDKDSLANNNSSSNDLKGKDNNNINGTTEIDKNQEMEIIVHLKNSNKIFLEGFCYMDKDK